MRPRRLSGSEMDGSRVSVVPQDGRCLGGGAPDHSPSRFWAPRDLGPFAIFAAEACGEVTRCASPGRASTGEPWPLRRPAGEDSNRTRGVGMIGQDHIRRMSIALAGGEVVAVADTDAGRAKEDAGGLVKARRIRRARRSSRTLTSRPCLSPSGAEPRGVRRHRGRGERHAAPRGDRVADDAHHARPRNEADQGCSKRKADPKMRRHGGCSSTKPNGRPDASRKAGRARPASLNGVCAYCEYFL